MSAIQVMLDLETMGTASDSAIIAIGAVKFTDTAVLEKFYVNVSLQSCIDVGLKIDGDTVMWWMQQSEEARASFTDNAVHINLALQMFSKWINGDKQVWGNGASFDNAILSSAYSKCQLSQPWKFWNDRCYRTIKSLYPEIKLQRVGTYHKALDDAESQALHLIEIMKEETNDSCKASS